MKSAYQLGREARDRDTNWDLNPFEENSYRADKWFDGWVDRDLEMFLELEEDITHEEWKTYTRKILK
jgi:hypothetical protein